MDKIDKIINYFRNLREEGVVPTPPTNNASSGNIAGFPPDNPPIRKKKRKYAKGGVRSRRLWLNYLRNK